MKREPQRFTDDVADHVHVKMSLRRVDPYDPISVFNPNPTGGNKKTKKEKIRGFLISLSFPCCDLSSPSILREDSPWRSLFTLSITTTASTDHYNVALEEREGAREGVEREEELGGVAAAMDQEMGTNSAAQQVRRCRPPNQGFLIGDLGFRDLEIGDI